MTRQQQVLDAAIRVLGTGGMRQLTHRAVDAEAGLPQGSTSNHFRTRDALIGAVLGRLLEHETALWAGLAGDVTTPEALADAVGALVERLAEDRVLTLARHALFVEVAQRPELRGDVDRAHRELGSWAVPLVAGLGSADPPADLALLLAVIDGLLANQLANPSPRFDPAAAVRTVLRGILAG
ncbi:TetR family transcriptional regulator [Saccharothrix sp. NRRL B-16348]|uniref:TetR/AcrR family transcriptional regulator n=1 Tax=Saccharothrix sp. NRRL B-16348 TaxID=1415542 RepID=UPI0006C231B5|nr:TetR/AcrR family transcriptional regulator [Saccharothrix sp. NRRL B-16348]KOX13718.1 TetR family transcriptional regulator [Saccharothrix sp. NRRL B-16348]